MQVKKQHLELDIEQQTGSKMGKEYIKAVYCQHAYLTSMQSTSCEMLGWMKHKLELRLSGEISSPRDGGAWWAAVYGVAQSRTRLKGLSNNRYMVWVPCLPSLDLAVDT